MLNACRNYIKQQHGLQLNRSTRLRVAIILFTILASVSVLAQHVRIDGITQFAQGLVINAGQIQTANGTAAAPSLIFGASGPGWYRISAGVIGLGSAGTATPYMALGNSGLFISAGNPIAWSATGDAFGTDDTGISRLGAGMIAFGNGTQGNASANLSANSYTTQNGGAFTVGGRAAFISPADGVFTVTNNANTIGSNLKTDALPTVASGFGTSPAITAGSTPFAGSINVGTGGTATTGVINFNGTAFSSAPFCIADTQTSNTASRVTTSTTQLTLTTTVAWTASDIVSWICVSAK